MRTPVIVPSPSVAEIARPSASRNALGRGLDLAVAGAVGGLFGLFFYVELVQTSSLLVRDALAGILIGGSIAFTLNAMEAFQDGAWLKLSRFATLGAISGAIGGAVGLLIGEKILGGFQGGLIGRAVSWAILGLGIGASQGVVYRSAQRLRMGLIGGSIGGFLGGLAFEGLRDRLGNRYDLSQSLGITILGAGLGLCLALAEKILGKVWVHVLNGRQEGRLYLLSQNVSTIGLDEHAEVGIFGDPSVARKHAEIERTAGGFVLRDRDGNGRTRLNSQAISGSVDLADGDRIEIGATLILFRNRAQR